MRNFSAVTAVMATMFLAGCATQSSNTFQAFNADDLDAQVKAGLLVQKTNSFFVLNDSSASMGRAYSGAKEISGSKLDVEKNLLNRFNRTIPSITLSSGLRSFGMGQCTDWSATKLNQAVQAYSADGFEKAITSLTCASGGTPIAGGLNASQADLAAASGNIALIVLSDGMDETNPVPAAEALKAQYGDKLCIYTVWVGNEQTDALGKQALQMVADASGCGFTTDAQAISTAAGMSDFVKRVFFKPGSPKDCSIDDDQDGVNNCADKCPNTPKGAMVDKDGCWAMHGVLFDFDSDKIKAEFEPMLKNAADVMQSNPGLKIEVQGHTDSYGSDQYNQGLSERRANAVKNDLQNRGVAAGRMKTIGFGETQPVESNATDAGRAYNRRVAFERCDK